MTINRMPWLEAYIWMQMTSHEDMELDPGQTAFVLMIARSLGNGVTLQGRLSIYHQELGAVLATLAAVTQCLSAQYHTSQKAEIQ